MLGLLQGEIVYANRAVREDFVHLAANNINVTGCIVLARYGGGGRSSKVCLLYLVKVTKKGGFIVECFLHTTKIIIVYGQMRMVKLQPK